MRIRMLSESGDYTIGQGSANFWINKAQGVGQNATTRLLLWRGEWFLDNTIIMPWQTQVLGYNTSALRDIAVKTVILQTFGVKSIVSYSSSTSQSVRSFTVSALILTIYSPVPVPINVTL